MASPLDTLARVSNKNKPRSLTRKTNMVGEVVAYKDKAITVKALSGPVTGQEIDIIPNKPVSEFSKPSKAQTSSYTPVGGILRFDGVEPRNGEYHAKWVNAWIKEPSDENKLLADQQASFFKTNRTDSAGRPIMSMTVLDTENEAKIETPDQMRQALIDAFKSTRAAMMIVTVDGAYDAKTFSLPGREVDGEYLHYDPEQHVDDLIEGIGEEAMAQFVEIMEADGLTIVPTKRYSIGSKTAMEIQKALDKAAENGTEARIMQVSPAAYEVPSIGSRLSGVMMRRDREGEFEIADVYVARLKEEFLKTAPQDARDGFNKVAGSVKGDINPDRVGWSGVADADLASFFEGRGIEFMDLPKYGWNRSSLHLMQFTGSEDFFVAKSHEAVRYGSPFPNLKCCEDLRKVYASEVQDAVLSVVKEPAADAKKEAEAPAAEDKTAPAAETAEAEDTTNEAAAELSEEEAANIDDMLASIGSEPIG